MTRHQGPRRDTVDQDRGLGVLGQTQLVLWTFKAQTLEVVPKHVIGFLVEGLDGLIGFPEVLTHTDSLGPLSWEDTDDASCHSVIPLSTRLESGHTGGVGVSIVFRVVVLVRPFRSEERRVGKSCEFGERGVYRV